MALSRTSNTLVTPAPDPQLPVILGRIRSPVLTDLWFPMFAKPDRLGQTRPLASAQGGRLDRDRVSRFGLHSSAEQWTRCSWRLRPSGRNREQHSQPTPGR